MRMSEVNAKIELFERARMSGFRVSFERREHGMRIIDMFPPVDEPAFSNEDDAWEMAGKLARATVGQYVNFYVVRGLDYRPVDNYSERLIRNY